MHSWRGEGRNYPYLDSNNSGGPATPSPQVVGTGRHGRRPGPGSVSGARPGRAGPPAPGTACHCGPMPADHAQTAPSDQPVPPVAERRPVVLEAHGDVRTDDWFWLRDKDDPAVIAHLEAENAYTEAMMAGTRDAPGVPLRRDGRPDRGDRPVGPRRQGSVALLRAHRGGQQLRDPLPAGGRRARGRRGGPARRERAGRGPRLLRPRQLLGQPRPPLARLLDRHHRR